MHLPRSPTEPCKLDRGASARTVKVFAADCERDHLKSIFDHTRFALRFLSGPAKAGRDGEPAAASIVSDALAEPLDLCAALAPGGPVILMSDSVDFAFRLAAARAGVRAVVRRPIDPIHLVDWLERLTRSEIPERLSVVVVDDDALTAELNAAVLRTSGIDVAVVCDPSRVLDVIEQVLPDLVLMDLRMPDVDGVELAQVIRQSRELVSTPIVFLSVERDEARQAAARRLGGDDFIQKPISPQKLIAQVRMRAERARILRSLIERDGLTGLVNHSCFHERLAHDLDRCRRTGTDLCVAMIDLDRFKSVNDRFGHPVGDGVLRSLATLLTTNLRPTDIVGRYGGEEFGVILPDTDVAVALRMLDRIRASFSTLDVLRTPDGPRVTFSAGIASSRDYPTIKDLVVAADLALYAAKDAGRNRIQDATPARPALPDAVTRPASAA